MRLISMMPYLGNASHISNTIEKCLSIIHLILLCHENLYSNEHQRM